MRLVAAVDILSGFSHNHINIQLHGIETTEGGLNYSLRWWTSGKGLHGGISHTAPLFFFHGVCSHGTDL